MPVISMLHDIIRTNFLDDLHHGVPHTHACHSEFEASMRIDDDDVLTGELSRKGNAEQLPFTARQQPSAAGGLRSRSAATAATPRCVIVAWPRTPRRCWRCLPCRTCGWRAGSCCRRRDPCVC